MKNTLHYHSHAFMYLDDRRETLSHREIHNIIMYIYRVDLFFEQYSVGALNEHGKIVYSKLQLEKFQKGIT